MERLRSLFSLAILLLFSTSGLLAQQDSVQSSWKLKRGFYESISFLNGDFSELNDFLIPNGFLPLDQSYLGVALGISVRPDIKDSYFTGTLFANNASSINSTNNKGVNMWSFGIHDEWHLDLIKDNRWRIGPDLGFGIGGMTLTLYEQPLSVNSFSSSVANLGSLSKNKYSSASIFINAGAGIDRRLKGRFLDFYLGFAAGSVLVLQQRFSKSTSSIQTLRRLGLVDFSTT